MTLHLATDKVNVFVADNNTGKSVFFKMLKVASSPTYYSPEDLASLIRHGANSAMLAFHFTNNALGVVCVTRKCAFYKFQDVGETQMTDYYYPPANFIKYLGIITNNENFVCNIVDTDQDLLLVNSTLSGNSELMKMIAENPLLGELEGKAHDLIKDFTSIRNKVNTEDTIVISQINLLEYVDVEKLRQEAYEGRLLLTALQQDVELYNNLTSLSAIKRSLVNYEELLQVYKHLGNLLKLQELLGKISNSAVDSVELLSLLLLLGNTINSFRQINPPTVSSEELSTAESVIALLANLQSHLGSVSLVKQKNYDELYSTLEKVSLVSRNLGDLATGLNTINECKEVIVDLEKKAETMAEKVKCPIYGEVLYNGKECIRYSN